MLARVGDTGMTGAVRGVVAFARVETGAETSGGGGGFTRVVATVANWGVGDATSCATVVAAAVVCAGRGACTLATSGASTQVIGRVGGGCSGARGSSSV